MCTEFLRYLLSPKPLAFWPKLSSLGRAISLYLWHLALTIRPVAADCGMHPPLGLGEAGAGEGWDGVKYATPKLMAWEGNWLSPLQAFGDPAGS